MEDPPFGTVLWSAARRSVVVVLGSAEDACLCVLSAFPTMPATVIAERVG